MSGRFRPGLATVLAVAAAAVLPASAAALPPPNDVPSAPGAFETYSAANGVPRQLQAVAELVDAEPDAGVPRCLGDRSFARTVWYWLPAAASARELTVEASGRTLNVVDLAAFVQAAVPMPAPEPVPPPPLPPEPDDPDATPTPTPTATPVPTATPTPTPPSRPLTREPNACAGLGAGGSTDADEPTAALTLRVPALRPILIQVGRRGARRSADDERALVSVDSIPLPPFTPLRGDRAGSATPRIPDLGRDTVELGGATITEEDPAQPPCPSLGTVWRRLIPKRTGKRLITVRGWPASTLTVFAGKRPTGDNVLDCVNRAGNGPLQMVVPVKKHKTVWIRLGTERRTAPARATVEVTPGEHAVVIDGGQGGFDPTPGGPGGGFPAACDTADVTRARIAGPVLRGSAGAQNRYARVPVTIRVRSASVCDAEIRLYGPKGEIYAKGRAVRLAPGRHTVGLPRLRTFKRGHYWLRVTGVSLLGKRVQVRGGVQGRLR